MKTYFYKDLTSDSIIKLTKRPAINLERTLKITTPIVKDVKRNGLQAAIKYAKKFDGFSGNNILVSKKEFDAAEKKLDGESKKALKSAFKNIYKFHQQQFPKSYLVETVKGVKCRREYRAIENVGLYIPGGNAVLPSTMLMLGIPAKIAGSKRVVVCSPSKNSLVNYALLYAAKLCGINEFYKIGGAQAIALMAYGDKKFDKVNKIFGPGNQYVTAAKLLISIDPEGAAIDMHAGPSEVLVIADENTNPVFVAADLLSQAEHGPDSQVVLVTNSKELSEQVQLEIKKQIDALPRKDFARQSLKNSFTLIVKDLEQAVSFSNKYAPEHLILNIKKADSFSKKIINAGSVFLGKYSPESAGDYASGTNHSLPTYGYAKSFGGVTVESFMKSITFQELTRDGLKRISNTVEKLAEIENLTAHKNAVSVRLNNHNKS
jgi:histidinol dehydrogenase